MVYYLADAGRWQLEQAIGVRAGTWARVRRRVARQPLAWYAGAVMATSALLPSLVWWWASAAATLPATTVAPGAWLIALAGPYADASVRGPGRTGEMNTPPYIGNTFGSRLCEGVLALALAAALVNCDRPARWLPDSSTSATVPAGRTEEVTLQRFECDERCWLEIQRADSSVLTGWCNAAVCAQWLDNGVRLPADLVGHRARINVRQKNVFIGTEEDQMEVDDVRGITLLFGPQ